MQSNQDSSLSVGRLHDAVELLVPFQFAASIPYGYSDENVFADELPGEAGVERRSTVIEAGQTFHARKFPNVRHERRP